jgi:hypothetical protein
MSTTEPCKTWLEAVCSGFGAMQAFGLRPKPRERLGRTGGAWLMFGDVVPLWREAILCFWKERGEPPCVKHLAERLLMDRQRREEAAKDRLQVW